MKNDGFWPILEKNSHLHTSMESYTDRVINRQFLHCLHFLHHQYRLSMPSIHPSSLVINSTLGNNVTIGPFCMISDCHIADNVQIEWSVLAQGSTFGENTELLWWSIIRESTISENCVIGCEVKKSHLWPHNKAKHLGTTIANSTTGMKVNFWSGVKCANYDGRGKGCFTIGDDVFLGSNTVLSVKADQTTTIGDWAKIGANLHISQDIPPRSLVYQDRENGKITVREGYYSKKN